MIDVTFAKFDPLGGQVSEGVGIFISQRLPEFLNTVDAAMFYQKQAGGLALLLYEHLPQGTFDRLVIELLGYKVSVYRGKTES